MENKEHWKDISAREKMQIINGTMLIIAAIILYFVAFVVTLTIHMEVVSAGATLLATGLAFFGITGYIKNQMIHFEADVKKQMIELEKKHRENNGSEIQEGDN